ncbi:glycosyltransferase [Clostridium estertheticum]|uniref:glycosyltransferase n=1 Tax=Clostridium estertheticum TaxID=238834 RepID=UPI0013E95C1B|nr:glycosyltransferase [Clostridium estertheticum]MBZ9686396.1 glycosyltransferase [Clostridium estertheticum]
MITSIVILTHNKLKYTKLCIESIREYTDKNNYEIIVVDNHSTDGTVNWLNNQRDIKSIFNEEGLGFPKGCNQGINIAEGDNILLLNNDVVVTPNWLMNLNKCLYSSEDIGAVGAVANRCPYYQQISIKYNNVEEMVYFAEKYNISDKNKWVERLKLIGFCISIKREVIEKVGLLDERFTPGNFEDDDYSLRIRKAGYRLMLCKDTFIHHYGSVTFGENPYEYSKILKINQKKFEEKWGFNWENYISYEIIKLIDKPKSQEFNVLEIGCGCGANLLEIKNIFKNANVYGIESNKNAGEIARDFAKVIIGNIVNCELSYQDKFFDYMIFSSADMNLNDSPEILKFVRSHLKGGGQILINNFNTKLTRL